MPGSYEGAAGLVTGLVIGVTGTYLILKATASNRAPAASTAGPLTTDLCEVRGQGVRGELKVAREVKTEVEETPARTIKKPHRIAQAWRRRKSAFTPTNLGSGGSGGGSSGGGLGGGGGGKHAPSLRMLSKRASLMQSSMDVADDDDEDGDGAGDGSGGSQLLDELKELTNDAAGGGITLSKDDLRTLTNKVTMTMKLRKRADHHTEAIERRESVARHISHHTNAVPDKFQEVVKGYVQEAFSNAIEVRPCEIPCDARAHRRSAVAGGSRKVGGGGKEVQC